MLRAAHRMLELVGFQRNDEVRCSQDFGEEGSSVRSAKLGGDEMTYLETDTDVEGNHVAKL